MLTTGLAFAATIPSDVTGNVYEGAITALMEKGIITGDTDGKFHPDSRLTRAQACIMVVKAMSPPAAEVMGTPTQAIKSDFPDMSGYGWAEGYIGYAVKKGIVNGYPDGTFKPGDLVVNATEPKKLTNHRASGSDDASKAAPKIQMSLEECMEYIQQDECIEVTPKSIRLRKVILNEDDRKRVSKSMSVSA